jgi:hypothetical protein
MLEILNDKANVLIHYCLITNINFNSEKQLNMRVLAIGAFHDNIFMYVRISYKRCRKYCLFLDGKEIDKKI